MEKCFNILALKGTISDHLFFRYSNLSVCIVKISKSQKQAPKPSPLYDSDYIYLQEDGGKVKRPYIPLCKN